MLPRDRRRARLRSLPGRVGRAGRPRARRVPTPPAHEATPPTGPIVRAPCWCHGPANPPARRLNVPPWHGLSQGHSWTALRATGWLQERASRKNCPAGMRWPGWSTARAPHGCSVTSTARYLADAEYGATRLRGTRPRGHGDPRCRGPQPGHPRLRARRGGRAPGRHCRLPVSCPGEPVLPAHALPRRAGRTRRGDPGRGGGRGRLGEDHRRFPEWAEGGPVPESTAATYDLETLRQAVDAAHTAGARVAVHSNLPDSGLAGIGADSIEHGRRSAMLSLRRSASAAAPGRRRSAPCFNGRDSSDPAVRGAGQGSCATGSAAACRMPSLMVSGYWPAPMSSALSRTRSRSWPSMAHGRAGDRRSRELRA